MGLFIARRGPTAGTRAGRGPRRIGVELACEFHGYA